MSYRRVRNEAAIAIGGRLRRLGANGVKRKRATPRRAPKTRVSAAPKQHQVAKAPTTTCNPSRNNRLAPGIRGSRRDRKVRWNAFDRLPEYVADALRDSRSMLCPVAALRLVNQGVYEAEEIARFLRQRAAWTDWRVLASDFGEDAADQLRPDAPKRRPSLGRSCNS